MYKITIKGITDIIAVTIFSVTSLLNVRQRFWSTWAGLRLRSNWGRR